jgi:O-antigen ligase
MIGLLFFYTLLFTYITWRDFSHGVFLLFLLLPTYLIRFSIGPLPMTALEAMVLILVAIFCFKKILSARKKNSQFLPTRPPSSGTAYDLQLSQLKEFVSGQWLLVSGIVLFLLGATISIFTSIDLRSALGEWKAFYVEPVLLALTIYFASKNNKQIQKAVLTGLTISATTVIIFTLWQVASGGTFVPPGFFQTDGTFRATAWYGFPNGVGLYIAPLVPLALFHLTQHIERMRRGNWKLEIGNWLLFTFYSLLLITAPFAIWLAKSTGALIGLTAGIVLLLLFYKSTRKITLWLLASGFLLLIALPSYNPIKQELLFQDRSGQIRLSMWSETIELLKDHPILGAGLASYSERIEPYHTTVNGEGIEIFHHPHNVFLTIWVNTGLVGLVGFILVLIWFFSRGMRHIARDKSHQSPYHAETKPKQYHLSLFLISSMTVLLTSGLVDSPYIKNDLSIVFWSLIVLMILSSGSHVATTPGSAETTTLRSE